MITAFHNEIGFHENKQNLVIDNEFIPYLVGCARPIWLPNNDPNREFIKKSRIYNQNLFAKKMKTIFNYEYLSTACIEH